MSRRGCEGWLRQRTDCHSTDGLVASSARGAPSDADPDANRSAGLHSYRVDLEVIETTQG